MKIYLASGDKHTFNVMKNRLLSYYDLEISHFSFREETFKLIKQAHENTKSGTLTSTGNSTPRSI